jgi:hypothetical protein
MVDKSKKKLNSDSEIEKLKKRQNKLNSLKNEFEGGKITSFDQIFAIFSPSPLAKELNIPFYSFKSKIADPGEFTNNELLRLAHLIDVDVNLVLKFIFTAMKFKNKFKTGDAIRV